MSVVSFSGKFYLPLTYPFGKRFVAAPARLVLILRILYEGRDLVSMTCFQAVHTSSAARRSRKVRKEKILSRTSGHSCSCRPAPAAGGESAADMRSEMSREVRIVPVLCTEH